MPVFTRLTDDQDQLLFALYEWRANGVVTRDSFTLVHEEIEQRHTLRLYVTGPGVGSRISGTAGELRAIAAAGYLQVEEIEIGLPERRRPALDATFTRRGLDYMRWRRLPAIRRFVSDYLPQPEDVRRVGFSPQIAVPALLVAGGLLWAIAQQLIWPLLQSGLQQLFRLAP